ncbi:MAG TPA: RnfABCDGE type electron transport complex subunit D, partial [Hydrogenophilus thermoluteolus]|nr:RnfABCDGE type electron transport complex subunit D [Hydrogenophilus thermoluteolus]
TWWDAFLGFIPGSLGETSALAILIGGLFLLYTKIASWRIVAGVAIGVIVTALLFNWFGPANNPMAAMPWYWHFAVGGLMLAMFFMATDPVSASMTQAGRWIFGLLIGFMVVLIRVANPAFPEGAMLAVLFANVWAPFIDYLVMRWHLSRRERRYVQL